jgi:hypothetical protein
MYSLSALFTSIKNDLQHRPVELYDIYLGSQTEEDSDTLHFINYYRTTNFFTYLSHAAQSYIPLGISRSEIKKTSRNEIERVSFKIDNVNRAMGAYAADHDFRNKRIAVRLVMRDYLSSYLDAKVVFDGFIQSILFDQKSLSGTATPKISSLMFETGWPFQLNCNCMFGDSCCKVNKEAVANKYMSVVTGGTTSTIIDSALTQVNDYWNWGTIIFTSGLNNGMSRKIVDFVNSTHTLTLDYVLRNTPVAGDTFILYRGCDKTLNMCENTYFNQANFHGFHTIPLKNV